MKIVIPSKGRAGNVETLKVFGAFKPILYVEPQDYAAYKKAYPKIEIVKLKKNNQGISYVRNQILKNFNGPILMLDDDIISIKKRNMFGKLQEANKADLKILLEQCELALKTEFPQVTISFIGSNWFNRSKWKINTRVWCFNGINCGRIKGNVGFDSKADVFEDYDFTAQIISFGLKNICLYEWAFDCKPMATNKGGWQMFNRKKKSEAAFEHLISKWPYGSIRPIVNRKTGIIEPQFNWRKL